ncbi:unnamed protein product, partial [marine sediment metagenome]
MVWVMAIGDIIGTVDELDFDLSGGMLPKIIKIGAGRYAVVYSGYSNDGYVVTMPIAADGTIGAASDVLEIDPAQGRYLSIVHLDGTMYAIAYSGPNNNGIVITLDITA